MKTVTIFSLLLLVLSCAKEKTFSFTLETTNNVSLNLPLAINLNEVNILNVGLFNNDHPIAHQIDTATNTLWFSPTNADKNNFTLKAISQTEEIPFLSALKNKTDMVLGLGNKPIIKYRYTTKYPPAGIDSIFKKSGYIHPILTPKGDTLSRIQPPDHYHHYGLWGPWTHTKIDTTRVDFWNIGDGFGTVKFKTFKRKYSGAIYSGFTATQEHIDLKTENAPQVALNEDLDIKLWYLNDPNRYMFDYTTTFSTNLTNGILFEAYRYGGGIGFRFNERWKADNCQVLTSEGKDRLTADGSNARWCIVSGTSADGKGTNGILFMSHPKNRMHPEPMRIWPLDANNGRGDMFFEFCPIRHKEWKIEPNKNYNLNYRMVVFDGELTAHEAEIYWQSFANPQQIAPTLNQ